MHHTVSQNAATFFIFLRKIREMLKYRSPLDFSQLLPNWKLTHSNSIFLYIFAPASYYLTWSQLLWRLV